MPWSVYEEKHLLDLIGERKSLKEIAQALGHSPQAVIEKIRRLGLSIEFVNRRVEQAHRARFRCRSHALASLLNHKNPRPAVIATESPLLHGNRCPQDVLGQCCGVHHRASETVAPWKTVKKIC
jgi:hypothetical protein